MNKIIVTKGQKFGELTFINEAEPRILKSNKKSRIGLFKCKCGSEKLILIYNVFYNKTSSCGCKLPELHGYAGTKLYYVWFQMKKRCTEKSPKSNRYYDRGIRVCQEWVNFIPFKDWALQNGYKEGLQIDRIDNSKGYYPENCRFVTAKENSDNRDITIRVIYKGQEYILSNLIREKIPTNTFENNYSMVQRRLNAGWSVEDAIDLPKSRKHHKVIKTYPKLIFGYKKVIKKNAVNVVNYG